MSQSLIWFNQSYPKDFKFQQLSKLKQETITTAITRFLYIYMRPISIVENTGFINLMKILEPRYEMVSRKQIGTKYIPKLYDSIKNEVLTQIQRVDQGFGITFDFWTNINQQSFITLTAHFVDSEFVLKSFVLKTMKTEQKHTSDNIILIIQDILKEFQLNVEEKHVVFVTVGAVNIKVALQKFEKPQINCFAHLLHNVLNKGLKEEYIEYLIDKCKKIVVYFKYSGSRQQILEQTQKDIKIPTLKLKLSTPTRWNFTYDMLSRLLHSKKAIQNIAFNDQILEQKLLITQEWDQLEALVTQLKPFYLITQQLCGEKYCTASILLPIQDNIEGTLLQPYQSDIEVIKSIKSVMLLDFIDRVNRNYNNHVQEFLEISTYLDPRFKNCQFFKNEQNKQQIISKLKTILLVEVNTILKNSLLQQQINNNYNKKQKARDNETLEIDRLNTIFGNLNFSYQQQEINIEENMIDNELTLYDLELPISPSSDVLQWWGDKRFKYYILSQAMKRYLCVLSTSVPSESIFSKAGFIQNERRNSISSHILDKLLFIQNNYKQIQSNFL